MQSNENVNDETNNRMSTNAASLSI